ncbi:MAG: hypothetical protein Q4B79_05240 [Moraxella sp.]|uniref:hypothetical protein n=1 Tax=Moraxella sp. TaxID=479 RepID=UPI0026DC6406|nr:hypothetical protein [Moraxella sp.]MDO4450348.1 hypothetical protein [Moraxella sp.]
MDIFNNDSEVLQIGGLTIENGMDSVLITGDLQIDKSALGRQQARVLYEFMQDLMTRFEALDDLPEQLTDERRASTWVDNPFL